MSPSSLESEVYRFLTFINSSAVEEFGWQVPLKLVCSAEVLLLLTNFVEYLYIVYLLLRIRAMHCNLHILLLLYGGQYFFSMISRLLLVYYQIITLSGSSNPLHNWVYIANYTRTICLFVAFSMLPFLVFERCFATCYAGTYESDRHACIPIALIIILMPISAFSAVAYIKNWLPIYAHCILLIALNIGGSILLVIITKCNIKLHNSYCTLEHLYSLSERFQVSENIKTCQWLSRIQGSILFFNIACSSILILEYITMNAKLVIIVNVCFNLLCTLYAAIVPVVVIVYTPEWSRETSRLYHLIAKPNSNCHSNLRTTFGEEMSYSDKNIESKVYFDQLQKNFSKHGMDKEKSKKRGSRNNSENEVFL